MKGITEKETIAIERLKIDYRGTVGYINQSMLKVYDSDPMDFYFQFVMGEKKEDKDTFATLVGQVAEFMVLECQCNELLFDDKAGELFAMYKGKKGGGQAYILADYLFEEYMRSPEGGMENNFREAFGKIKAVQVGGEYKYYKGKTIEWALDNFSTKDKEGHSAMDYYKFKEENIGKKVIDENVITKSREVASMFRMDEHTRDLFDFANDENSFEQRHIKFPILWRYNGLECKSELDQFWLNEMDGYAIIDDMKCTFDNESFNYSYIKNGYYLQNGFYYLALRYWLNENGMRDFDIGSGARFIVGDTSRNKRRPLVYETSYADVDRALQGFKLRGVEYKGINELMADVEWALENGIFNCSRENYALKGKVKLNIPYE